MNRPPLTEYEKQRIYAGKLAGRSLRELAVEIGCTWECARKWWRVGRKHGEAGLRAARKPRARQGALTRFPPELAAAAVALKRAHPGWGADRVKEELAQQAADQAVHLPSRSRLAALFHERCPECVAARHPRPPAPTRPLQASGVHQVWQMDSQENLRLQDGGIATVCSIRDPFGAAMLASQAFSVATARRWRKLTLREIQTTLRAGFAEWATRPDSILTDNELVQAGDPENRFPSLLTLWLVGLDIAHQFIRPGCPTDQPHIERNHRTLSGWTNSPEDLHDLTTLQQALDRERAQYNWHFPSRAHGCARQPPLVAHPQLLRPRRPYAPDQELALFDLQRVFDFLARLSFVRKVHQTTAHICLGDHPYCLTRPLLRQHHLKSVQVRMDAEAHQWVVLTDEPQPIQLLRLEPKGLDVQTITGLEPFFVPLAQPLQLELPFWLPTDGVR